MEPVKPAHHIQEQPLIIEVAPLRYVLLDKFFRLTDVALNATLTQELTLRGKSAFLTTVTTDKNLDLMDPVLTAPTLRELREQAYLADLIHVILDRESKETVLASTVSCIMLFQATEECASSQLASQW